MALNIDGIKSAFQNGDFARPNLFEVEIPSIDRDMKVKVKGAQLPAATVEAIDVSYQNRKIKVAGDRVYAEWTVSVYNDDQHNTRAIFLDWQSNAAQSGKPIYGENPDSYKRTALVRQFNRQGEETAVYNFYGIFPTEVGEIQLSWDSNNEVETFDCTIAIDYWTLGDGLTA